MSKNWYPMINYENCTECGSCVEFCSHGVYDKDKAPAPYVINPEGCIEGCKGCAGICPADAISYFGDNGESKSGGCGCGCGCGDDVEPEKGCGCGCGDGCDCGEDSCC